MSVDGSEPFDPKLRAAFEPAYDLERELTGGGMSRVFLATERALGRQVVIKVLPPDLAAGVNRERFRREIQLAAQLQHPHIVPLYAAGAHGDLLYYTMPFIEGESLKHAIQEHGPKHPFTLREILRILHDVSDALAYAHARGVVHRDIKPGNVLRSGMHAVVTDFGVAKAITAALPAAGMTTSGMAIGTPAYMAPEQLAGDPAADYRVDIYAVGLLAYELLTGEAPFNEKSPQATLAAQLTTDPVRVDRKRRDTPPALAALVMKCLAKLPDQRPQSANELVATLDAMTVGTGELQPLPLPRRRLGAAVAAAALLAVAAAVAIRARSGGTAAAHTSAAAPASVPVTTALTRADSLAIARAVEKRMEDRTVTAPSVAVINAKAIAAMERAMIDSVLDSLRKLRPAPPGVSGGPPGALGGGPNRFSGMTPAHIDSIYRSMPVVPRRRVVVADPPNRGNAEIQADGIVLMDAVRRRLGTVQRFSLLNRDSTNAVLLHTRNPDSVMHSLGAEMALSVRGTAVPGSDSVRWILSIYDTTSHLRAHVDTLGPLPLSGTAGAADSLARLMVRALFQLERSPGGRADGGRADGGRADGGRGRGGRGSRPPPDAPPTRQPPVPLNR